MRHTNARWVLSATLVAESAWLYSAIAVVGLAIDTHGGSLAWPVVLAVMGISLTIVHLALSEAEWVERAYRYRALIGLVVLYLAVASQLATTVIGLDLLWATRVFIGEPPVGAGAAVVLSAIYDAIGIYLNRTPLTPDKILNALEGGSPGYTQLQMHV